MNNRFVLIAAVIPMIALNTDAITIGINDLSFDQDGIATGSVSVDGYLSATLNWDNSNAATTVAETTKNMKMYVDLDGSASSTADQIYFSLSLAGKRTASETAPVVFMPSGSPNPGWNVNGAPTIGGNAAGTVTRSITIAVSDVTNGTGEIDEVNFTKKNYFADEYMVVNGVQEGTVLINGNYTYTDPNNSDSLKFNTTGQSSYMLGAMDLTLNVAAIPEPATLGLFGLTSLGLLAYRRKK